MVRWSSEPRRTPLAEESLAASLSRLLVACSRVITNDDTLLKNKVNTFYEQNVLRLRMQTDRWSRRWHVTFDPSDSRTRRL